jgi:hypothetical protein
MLFSQEHKNVCAAYVKARGTIGKLVKDSEAKTGTYGYKYASLAAVFDTITAPLLENGLAIAQDVEGVDNGAGVVVDTMLIHTSGEYIHFAPLAMPVAQRTPQGMGSAISYARRYAILAALALAAEDDDGEAATARPQAQQRPVATNGKVAHPPAVASTNATIGETPDGWNPAWASMADYPAATEWGRQHGVWANPKHFDNSWRKAFADHAAHDPANAPKFLAAWHDVVNQHTPVANGVAA